MSTIANDAQRMMLKQEEARINAAAAAVNEIATLPKNESTSMEDTRSIRAGGNSDNSDMRVMEKDEDDMFLSGTEIKGNGEAAAEESDTASIRPA